MKVLIVLNDGTDEIYNLHAFPVGCCREKLLWDLAATFLSQEQLADDYISGDLDDPHSDIFEQYVDRLILQTKQFLVVDEDLRKVYEKVEDQNASLSSKCFKSYKDEDFAPWGQIEPQLKF